MFMPGLPPCGAPNVPGDPEDGGPWCCCWGGNCGCCGWYGAPMGCGCAGLNGRNELESGACGMPGRAFGCPGGPPYG